MKIIFILICSVFINSLKTEDIEGTNHIKSIVLGSGCFWGAEKMYQEIPGVIDAISGYADGEGVEPKYREITKIRNRFNPNNHAEVVKVIFNSNKINLQNILKEFFESHDPTQVNRQGNDLGTQYRSIILITESFQEDTVRKVLEEYQGLLFDSGYGKISTEVKPLVVFHEAENYHQDYLLKNPNGYCPDHSTGVTFLSNSASNQVDNSLLMKDKHILVIESENYCPYCEKFRKEVLSSYEGSIPVQFRLASELGGLSVYTETWATQTIIFINDGKEVFGNQGYMSSKEFYKVLGAFKLGNSEAFNVAFEEGTDQRYCKEYEIFKNTPDGTFVDKLSGAALFDTRYRFNSGTGWLSFTQPIPGSVIERPDNSFGMRRIEIRSKTSGIHLGHVFPDGPRGNPRYCINATVLDFQPRDS